jgi:hypothetical protein
MSRRCIRSSNLGRWFRFGWRRRDFFFGSLGWDRAWEVPWPTAWVSSNLSYGAWNEARFLPLRSTLWEELILWTYRGENRPREASDGEAARAAFNGSGGGVQWCSSSKDPTGGDGVGGGSSSKHRIGTGGYSVAARQRQRGSAMAARVWAKFAWDSSLFIGVLVLNRRRQKS